MARKAKMDPKAPSEVAEEKAKKGGKPAFLKKGSKPAFLKKGGKACK